MLLKRERCLEKIRPFYDLDIIKVLVGSRRAGKSKVLELIINELKEKGVNEQDILYMNFENLDFEEISDYKKLNTYVKEHKGTNKQYLFFDEIQHVSEFEKAINSFRVSFDCSIFITGSNSKMLSSEISTLLTGRIIEFNIYPFCFEESEQYKKELGNQLINNFADFLELGGYPFRFNLESKDDVKSYLNELYNNICEKDIFSRDAEIEKIKFNRIASYVLLNAGNEFNPESIYNYLKSNNGGVEYCSIKSIYNYLDRMEKSFLIKPIYRYNISGKQILRSNPKYYAIDNGMRIIKSNSNNYDRGRFLENLICVELLSRGYEVYIGKTYKGEVDFVVIKNGRKCFIQVAYVMESEETIAREFSAFSPIKDASPKYVLSLDTIDMSRNGITHLNIIDFLTHKKDLFLS
ncbi:MAG: ATP-binding protein [Christensenella sp.]|nr:ATP-binding protein [Christensenella sp.]